MFPKGSCQQGGRLLEAASSLFFLRSAVTVLFCVGEPRMHGTRSVLNLWIIFGFWKIHMYIMRYLGVGLNSEQNSLCFSSTKLVVLLLQLISTTAWIVWDYGSDFHPLLGDFASNHYMAMFFLSSHSSTFMNHNPSEAKSLEETIFGFVFLLFVILLLWESVVLDDHSFSFWQAGLV